MDESTAILDLVPATCFENRIADLKHDHTIIIVVLNRLHDARSSARTTCFHKRKLVEDAATYPRFTNPGKKETKDYITGITRRFNRN